MQVNQVTQRIETGPAMPAGKLCSLALLLTAGALLSLFATPALAAKTHRLKATFTGAGAAISIAVDDSSGNVFTASQHPVPFGVPVRNIGIFGPEGGSPVGVADPFTIDGFNWDQNVAGVAVDNAATSPSRDSLYVVERNPIVRKFTLNPISEEYELKEALSASPAFEEPNSIAIDSKGNVFVSDRGADAVVEFDPTGTEIDRFDGVSGGIAVDQAGDLFVLSEEVLRFDANNAGEIVPGTEPMQLVEKRVGEVPRPQTIAVDLDTGSLFVAMEGGAEKSRVDQYSVSCAPEGSGADERCLPEGEFGRGVVGGARSLAVNPVTGTLYVGDWGDQSSQPIPKVFVFGPSVVVPAAVIAPASNVTGTSVTLSGTVNPSGSEVDECKFEWGESTTPYEHATPCVESPAEIGSGNAPRAVHVELPGLGLGTTYHFRLVATTGNTVPNEEGPSVSADASFTTLGPQVHLQLASQVSDTTAKLKGLVNPETQATSYVFEYVDDADFQASEYANATSVPLGGEAIGSGSQDVEVAQQLNGLTPFTKYHFRIVATNTSGSAHGPDRSFTTYLGAPPGPPDSRAYEQVTPVNKNGASATGAVSLVQAASGGNGVTYASGGGIPGTEGAQQYPTYLATRGADWSTQGLLPSATFGSRAGVLGWSEDLSRIYYAQGLKPQAHLAFLQRDSATQATQVIAAEASANLSTAFNFVGASSNGSTVVFESDSALLPGASTKGNNTYAWDSSTGKISLAGVFNEGSAPFKGSFAGSNSASGIRNYTEAEHAVSSDGSRVFFSDAGLGQLYVRKNPTQPQSARSGEVCTEPALACTVQISASQRAIPDPKGKKPAIFVSATPDGEESFFTSPGKLTDNANTGSADKGNDLYRYRLGTGELADLTPDSELGDPNGADVQGVLGTSDDGSYVYFAANGVLVHGATTPGNCEVTGAGGGDGECNLYLYHSGVTTFIARMQLGSSISSDGNNWLSQAVNLSTAKTSRVSADGRTLLFRAIHKLTAYDNAGTPEFYLYSAPEDKIQCVSCNPTGAAPVGTPAIESIETLLPSPGAASILTRNLSKDGQRVFFETPDKLVVNDINGVKDVYEWEADGAGSCHGALQNGGCLYLISTGTDSEPSFFGDADERGDNVFFFTAQSLVGQDKDQIVDIYDARSNGGIASQNPPPPPSSCAGEASCMPALSPPPGFQSAGSESFSEQPGEQPQRCKGKKVRKHGRCVKKGRASHKKKHHDKSRQTRKHR